MLTKVPEYEAMSLPNYTQHAQRIVKTEIQTLSYKLDHIFDLNNMTKFLNTPDPGSSDRAITHIECLPKIP
jgi:hypothetical protein